METDAVELGNRREWVWAVLVSRDTRSFGARPCPEVIEEARAIGKGRGSYPGSWEMDNRMVKVEPIPFWLCTSIFP